MTEYISKPLMRAAEQFAKLPGVGLKTAQKYAYELLTMSEDDVLRFSIEILEARKSLKYCEICQNFSENNVCYICARSIEPTLPEPEKRNRQIVCVCAEPKDVSAFERGKVYKGVYHVLHGLINPLEFKGPDDIELKSLILRLEKGDINEIIMATPPTIEGEATAVYIANEIKNITSAIKITRLAYGLPAGGKIEYCDNATLSSALEHRLIL